MSDKFDIINDDSAQLVIATQPASTHNLTFHSAEGGDVGKLSWDTGVFVFEGNAEESAKIFFDWLNAYLPKSETK